MSESHVQPSTEPMPTVPAERAEPCRECGAPLAADQRYCLNCGRRRSEPRLDFRRYRGAAEAAPNGAARANVEQAASGAALPAAATGPQGSGPEHKPQRDYTPLAAAGGIAVLGLMLLVGVLIGRGDGNQVAAPPPQVVRVGGGGEEATASAEEGALGGAAAAVEKKGKKGKGAKGGAASGGGAPPPPEITASDSELEALQGKSPQEYSEAAAKLPDEIATPGKAPPVDSKAPGGGSKGTAIE